MSLPPGGGPREVLVRHPLPLLMAALTVAGLVASRGLWGKGFLQGGALLPAPDGAGDWWALYAQAWHRVGLGSGIGTAPYVALLALPATLLLGKAWLAVDIVMLLAVPLAAVGAWFAAGRLVRGLVTRVWMTVAYALVPVVTGAVTSGHLGTVVVAVVLPWFARSAHRLLEAGDGSRWAAAWGTGLMLAIASAFAPVCWPIALLVGIVSISRGAGHEVLLRAVRWLVALAVPVVVLAPWSWRVVSHPGLLLTEAGAVDVPGASIAGSPWQLAFARVDAAGEAPWWIGVGLSAAAVAALARRDTRARVAGAWVVVVAGLAAAAVMWSRPVDLPLGAGQAYAWLGVPVVVATAGAVAAAGIAADGLGRAVGAGSFGWRQPVAVVAALAGLATPVLGLGWWVGVGPSGDLRRADPVPLPAYMVDAMESTGQRVLVLETGGGAIRYQVLGGDGLRLGDESVLPAAADPRVAPLVAEVLSESRPGDARRLAALGIGYVALPTRAGRPARARTVTNALDALPGLSRTSTDQAALAGWQVAAPDTRTEVVGDGPARAGWLVGQALAWLVVVVLAAPGARREPSSGAVRG